MPLKSGGTLRVEKNFVDVVLPPDLPEEKMDNRILKVCRGLAEMEGTDGEDAQVILVTKDLLLRIKAQILGIRAEDFTTEQVSERDQQYTGRAEVYVPEDLLKEFKKKGVPLQVLYQTDERGERMAPQLWENQFLILRGDQSVRKTMLGRVEQGRAVPLRFKKSRPYGVSPRNSDSIFCRRR